MRAIHAWQGCVIVVAVMCIGCSEDTTVPDDPVDTTKVSEDFLFGHAELMHDKYGNKPSSFAGIEIIATSGGKSYACTTDAQGSYVLYNVPLGTYDIHWSYPGYDDGYAQQDVQYVGKGGLNLQDIYIRQHIADDMISNGRIWTEVEYDTTMYQDATGKINYIYDTVQVGYISFDSKNTDGWHYQIYVVDDPSAPCSSALDVIEINTQEASGTQRVPVVTNKTLRRNLAPTLAHKPLFLQVRPRYKLPESMDVTCFTPIVLEVPF